MAEADHRAAAAAAASAAADQPLPSFQLTSRQSIACALACAGAGAVAAVMALRFYPAIRARVRARRPRRSNSNPFAAPPPLSSAAPLHSEVVVLGCGSSTGVPRATCVTDPNSTCQTCKLAMQGGRSSNRNWRGNPSLLIRFVQSGAAAESGAPVVSHIQIDVCKTFLATALRVYPRVGVRTLDSVIITHEHADAVLGMDDLRSMQSGNASDRPARMPVHVSQHTLRSMKLKFPYLVEGSDATDDADAAAKTTDATISADAAAAIAADNVAHASSCSPSLPSSPGAVVPVCRHVAMLSWPVVRPFVAFRTCGLDVLPLPVIHGEDYVSLAYLFGTGLGAASADRDACLYISDVSRIPAVTWHFLCTGVLPSPPAAVASDAAATAEWFERFNLPQSHPLPSDQSKWTSMPSTPAGPVRDPVHGAGSSPPPSPSPSPVPPRISLLVIDALFPLYSHNTHFNLPQALQFIERLQPRRALITGMSDLFEYHRDNAELLRRRRAGELTVDVQLAFDGMRVPLNL